MKAVCLLLLLGVSAIAAEHISAQKTDQDVHDFARALKRANIDHETKVDQLQSLKQMDRDLKAWEASSPAHRKELSHDLHSRMATIKKVLEGSTQHSFETIHSAPHKNFEEVAKVAADIESLRQALEESSMPAPLKQKMEDNLSTIKKDTARIAASTSQQEQKQLHQAIQLRVKALKTAISSSTKYSNDEPQVESSNDEPQVQSSKVDEDVQSMRTQISASSLDKDTKLSMEENLDVIQKDASRYATSSSAQERERLQKAMHLRVEALREVFSTHQSNSAEAPAFDDTAAPALDNTAVINDVAHLQAKISESDLPSADRRELAEKLDDIRSQAVEMTSATQASRTHLAASMKEEISSIKQKLTSSESETKVDSDADKDDAEEDAEPSFIDGAATKLEELKSSISSLDISASSKAEARKNIHAMEQDLAKIQDGNNSQNLKKALQLRFSALRKMLGDADEE